MLPLHTMVYQNSYSLCLEAFVANLKECIKRKDLKKGLKLHALFEGNGFIRNHPFVGSILVDLYVKCGSFSKARETFDRLPVKGVLTWNALILGYIENREYKKVFELFDHMNLESICPDSVTFVCTMKACGQIRDIKKGKEMYVRIAAHEGFWRNVSVGGALVDMHVKLGSLIEAQTIFDSLPVRDVMTWTSLIGGYADHGYCTLALSCFQQMQLDGINPDAWTFFCSLKACIGIGADAIYEGQAIYAEICRKGFLDGNIFLCCNLIHMYAKCGFPRRSQEVFDKSSARNVISWTALILGYAENSHAEKAMDCFEKMKMEGISPNEVTYISILKACTNTPETINKGRQIHKEIECKGFLEEEPAIGNSLVDLYARWGLLDDAQIVFNSLFKKDTASWNVLIAGYCENGHGEEALECYGWMQSNGFSPDVVTFTCLLKACGLTRNADKGEVIHTEISRRGLLGTDVVIGNALVDMYFKCGLVEKAQEVFIKLQGKDVVTWTTLIGGWVESGHSDHALEWFEKMLLEGISPNLITFLCGLKACTIMGDLNKGREIHAEIERKWQYLKGDVCCSINNALVDMYAKCGFLLKAQEVFNKLQVKDVVTWNTLIDGYASQGQGEEALKRFDQMRMEGISPDITTLLGGLKACSLLGTPHRGQGMHSEIAKKGLLEEDSDLGNALVDMYAKCGLIMASHNVFDKLQVRDLVSWNSLIGGYAHHGKSEKVLEIFDDMLGKDMKPGMITFVVVLTACGRNGLMCRSNTYFEAMSQIHGIIPTPEHYTCIVDILGRVGQLYKAVAMIKNSSFFADLGPWIALLGACKKWGNVKLGREAFEHAVALDRMDPASYTLMCQIYADNSMHEESNAIKTMLEEIKTCNRHHLHSN